MLAMAINQHGAGESFVSACAVNVSEGGQAPLMLMTVCGLCAANTTRA